MPGGKAIIAGCGIAGPVMALALRKAGWQAEIYEANDAPPDTAGVFLNVVPNGMNVLKTLGISERIATLGFPFGGIVFHDERGRQIGAMDYGDTARQKADFGAEGIVIRRGLLQRGLREAAIAAGVPVAFGKTLTAIDRLDDAGVRVRFGDGSTAEGDVLIGCDGIRSRVRALLFPEAADPVFTGIAGYGGFSRGDHLPPPGRMMHMTFGREAFFGYAVAPDGEVYWFGNVASDRAAPAGALHERLMALHGGDAPPVREILKCTEGEPGWYPIDELPALATWHRGAASLVGDAAHAISPHVGQGASLAMEDALVLAKCLRDIDEPAAAFAAYENLRRERVEEAGRAARRSGSSKVPGPVGRFVRNLLMPAFLKLGEKSARKAFAYQIDWNERVAITREAAPLRAA